MTDDTNPVDTSADDASRRNRARNRVVEFADADPELREKMQKIMQPINTDPSSFQAIVTYGNAPLEELGKVASSMIEVQRKFDKEVNVLDNAVDDLQKTFKNFNMSEIAKATKNLAAGAAKVGVKSAQGGFAFGKGVMDAFSGANKRKGDDEKLIAQMQNTLPAMLDEMVRLIDNISKTEEGIKEVLAEAEKLGIARIHATRELNVYVGAGKEVLRRYKETYIPEAQGDFEASGDPEDEMYMKDVLKRQDDFLDRMTVLEGSRNQGVMAAQQLKQIMETMEEQLKKIQSIKYNSQNEWKAMFAAAGIAGSSLKAAQTIRKADEFGDRIHDETMKMMEESHRITLNSKSRGTIDPAKLIEASDRLQKMIESEHQSRVDRNRMLEKTATELRQATDKLLDAANSSDQKRVLESLEAVKRANDNADKPAATDAGKSAAPKAADAAGEAPRQPRRRNGKGPEV